MKLSDYVFQFLKNKNVDTVFFLPGGGCMHILDSMGSSSELSAVSLLHEQAVAIASEAYANTKGKPGVALVTTGPGGTNTVTGVLAAYLDSSPCFFLSGQVKTTDLKSNYGVRSHGSQEADIVEIVRSITKYAVMVTDKNTIRFHLERAWHEMTAGRCGPVWIDIPLDIQGAQIEEDLLAGYEPPDVEENPYDADALIAALNISVRPVIIAGNGLARCKDKFHELLNLLQIPVIPTWKAMDYVPNDHPLYAGRAGGMGDRHGNLAMQNADLILSLGSRLDHSITGYDRSAWATKAEKFIVDIDENEIKKLEGAKGVTPIIANVSDVIDALIKRKNEIRLSGLAVWKNRIAEWKTKYPIAAVGDELTTYHFVQELCRQLPDGAHVAPCSAGTTAEIFFQAFNVRKNQVIRSNHGLGAMGFDIPNAIGMCVASGGKDVICVAGDGGMQLNFQELAVIYSRKLPIKLFVINNNGYASIRNMQNNHFKGRHVSCDPASGLCMPDLKKVAMGYCIEYREISALLSMRLEVENILNTKGPIICEVFVNGDCLVLPRTSTIVMPDGIMKSSPLENQYPFLSDDEIKENMLI